MKKINIKFKLSKKMIALLASLILVLVASSIFLFACKAKKPNENLDLTKHLIEVRDVMFISSDEEYTISLLSGEREKDYSLDGQISELVPFGVLILNRTDGSAINSENITYAITFDESYYTGNMEKSPYDNSFLVDIETSVPQDSQVSVTINLGGGQVVDKTLECVSKNFAVSKDRAIELATSNLKSNISKLNKSGEWEAYVRILKDYSDIENKTYYWYIAFIGSDGSTAGILIDSANEEIVSLKV